MLTIFDPSELKAADIYRQARTVASKTSRGTDSNWYRGPEELPCQWHIWFDGGREVCSAIYSRNDNRWQVGPALPLVNLTTAENVEDLLGEFLSSAHFPTPPKAIGVILHIADEFTLAEIGQPTEANAETSEDLALIRYNLVDDPKEVLADREVSTDTTTWRLLPFWGAAPGQPKYTAVALSRAREVFLQELLACAEGMRLPIRVAITCAPVEALASLPLLRPDLEGGYLVALQYLKFTAVFAVNAQGELRSVRTLAHRGGSLVPSAFGDILWNMAVGAELAGSEAGAGQPRVLLVSSDPRSLKAAKEDLDIYKLSRQTIHFETVDLAAQPGLENVPGNRIEFLMYDPSVLEAVRSGSTPLAKAETFKSLWSGWASQSFFDTGKLDHRYPTFQDLKLLRFTTWFIYALTLAMVASAAYGTYSLFAAMNHPSWQMSQEQVDLTKGAQNKLLGERKQIELTGKLLQPRSRGWVNMEFLLTLFPEDSGVRLENFDYSMEANRPAPAKGGKGKGKTVEVESTGLTRTWSFKGVVKPKAMELLNSLNSQRGLKALFETVAQATGDQSYAPDPTRQLTVTLTQGRNSKFQQQPTAADLARDPSAAYPFNFDATITQTLTDKDPLALPVPKPF